VVVLLGVIALSTLVMALIQVGVLVYAARLGRRLEALTGRLEQDIRPIIEAATAATANASTASSIALAQVERADRLLADLAVRVDETAASVQRGLLAPAREGRALLAGFTAGVAAIREMRRAASQRRANEEEDPLFIG